MTIEPSLVIWTVLCFLALLVILKKLLFQPMLTFMDARKAKVLAAREAKTRAAEEHEAEVKRLEEEYAAAEAKQREAAAEAMEKLHDETVQLTAQKRAEAAARLENDRAAYAEDGKRIRETLEPKLSSLALTFVNYLQQWQDDHHSAVDAESVAAPYADMNVLTQQQDVSVEITQDDLQRLAEEYASEDRRALQKAAAILEEAWLDAKDVSEKRRTEYAERLKDKESSLEKEADDIQHKLEPQLSDLANAFIQRLQKWQEEAGDLPDDEEHADVSLLTHLLGENDSARIKEREE